MVPRRGIGMSLGLGFAIEDTIPPVESLKVSTLYRLRIENYKLVEPEKLITDFGRIRDAAMGYDGFVYSVLEHNETGSLWCMVPR